MTIHFFGSLGERIGRTVELALPEAVRTVADLRAYLAAQHGPELLHPSVRACVGDEIVDDATALAGADAVEFFPPLSGG